MAAIATTWNWRRQVRHELKPPGRQADPGASVSLVEAALRLDAYLTSGSPRGYLSFR